MFGGRESNRHLVVLAERRQQPASLVDSMASASSVVSRRRGDDRVSLPKGGPTGPIYAALITKYLISFPSEAMVFPEADLPDVSAAAHAVVAEAKAAGVWVFGGGIDEEVDTVLVAADGSVSTETYPRTGQLKGGYTVLEVPSREAAVEWATKIAIACRCAQELSEFMYDPES